MFDLKILGFTAVVILLLALIKIHRGVKDRKKRAADIQRWLSQSKHQVSGDVWNKGGDAKHVARV